MNITLLFLLTLNVTAINAQNTGPISKTVSQNLLMRFNKTMCNAGDSLKFKCFVINRIDHAQDDHNLYVVLSDKAGKLIWREKYLIINSGSNGVIPIPSNLQSGLYNVEVFTPYLINNNITKINEIVVHNTSTAEALEVVSDIYYDNNRLVSKMPNSFYIKTSYSNRKPAVCEVLLSDDQGNLHQSFFTDVNGVAKITFVPLKNRLYRLDVRNNNKVTKVALVKPDGIGINMLVSYDSNIVKYKIVKNGSIQGSQDAFTITGYQKDQVVYTSQFSFDDYAILTGGFNVEALHTGLLKLVLTDKNGIAVSSTLLYFQNNTADFQPVSLKTSMNPSEKKSQYDVSLGSNATSFVSIAVEEVNAGDINDKDDLDFFYNNQLNSPEITTVVDYYQINTPAKAAIPGKYKMLEPNIRLLSTSEVNGKFQPKLNDDYAIVIRGKAYTGKNEKLLSGGVLNISYNENDKPLYFTTPVNADGSFILDSLIFSGRKKFYYKYFDKENKEQDSYIKVVEGNATLDSLLFTTYNYKPALRTSKTDTLLQVKLLPEIKAKTETKSKKQSVNDLYTTGVYAGQSSVFIDNINNPPGDGSMSATEFIKNRIPNIAFQNGNIVNTRNFSMGNKQFWIVGVVIDESSASPSDLSLIMAKDVALVKFFDVGHVSVSANNAGGLLAVYTKSGKENGLYTNDANYNAADADKFFEYEGFKTEMKANADKGTDMKSGSIYWNPSIILPKNQNTYSFHTEPLKPGHTYRIKVKGYNELGKLINFDKIITN